MRITLLAVAMALFSSVLPVSAQAVMQHYQLNIPRQPLDTALRDFASETGLQIARMSDAVDASAVVGPMRGNFSAEDALKSMLSPEGLTYKFVNPRTIAIMAMGSTATASPKAGAAHALSSSSQQREKEPSPKGDGFRVAQVGEGAAAGAATVESQANQSQNKSEGSLQEVVVTAQKRAELLDKVPLAITALNMGQLTDAGVTSIQDLTSSVPDVQIHTIGIDDFVGINIRGISDYAYTGNDDPAVSTYIDGVYVGLSPGFASELYDLERVEVLRGPQGTLYGRNATGGNVNVITASPKHEFATAADASYGNYNDVQVHGMVNLPLTDDLAVRAAFMTHRSDGYFDSRGYTARNYGAADDFGGRLTALWSPSSAFRWRLSVDYFLSQGTPFASIATGPDGNPRDGLSPYYQPVTSIPEPLNYIRSTSIRSRVDWSIAEPLTVAYIAGYQDLNFRSTWATTGDPNPAASPAFVESLGSQPSSSQYHELNVNYDAGPIKNVFGGSYYRQIGPSTASFWSSGPGDYVGSYGPQPPGGTKSAWGVFEQGTYSLTDHLRLTAGGRYSKETQFAAFVPADYGFYCLSSAYPGLTPSEIQALTPNLPGCFPLGSSPSGSASWSNISWKGALEADLSHRTLGYLSVTTGFKSGALQLSSANGPGFPPSILPEKVTNYELGLKVRFFDDSANLRVALFDEEYKDLQVFQLKFLPSLGYPVTVTTNAAKARIYGAELESAWNVSRSDHISGFANYLRARYADYADTPDPLTGLAINLTGNQMANAPQESLRLQYAHDFAVPNGGTISPMAAVYWQSTSYLTPSAEPSYYRVGAYSKTDLTLTYMDPSGHWRVAGYVQNLENKAVRTGQFTAINVYSDFAAPRILGIRVSYQ